MQTNKLTPRNRSESGLGVVEVIIAVLVLMAVASAITLASMGGAKLRGAARLQVAMTASGKHMTEDISGNRAWMESCQTISSPCNVAGYIDDGSKELDDVDGQVDVTRAEATPLDSDVDGIAPNDRDGLVPDYYRVELDFAPQAELASRYGTTAGAAKRTVVTTIDRRGDQAKGSLSIEICRVTNQSDERMAIQGCNNGGTSALREAGCSGGRQPCTSVFGWVANNGISETSPSPFVTAQRIDPKSLGISVVSEATTWRATSAQAKVGADGRLLFEDVPAGSVRINGIPTHVAGAERWKTKEQPAYLGAPGDPGSPIVVDPGVRARALVVYRPGFTNAGVRLHFNRRTTTRTLGGPYSGHNIVVGPWAPTHSYVGPTAAQQCNFYSSLFDIFNSPGSALLDCAGVSMGVPAKNCATVYVKGWYYYKIGGGIGYWATSAEAGVSFKYHSTDPRLEDYWDDIKGYMSGPYARTFYSKVRSVVACTEYWEEYRTTYYRHAGTTQTIRDGAAHPVTYSMAPMPEHRHPVKSGDTYIEHIPQCVVPVRFAQCSGVGLTSGLVPGLNTGLGASFGDSATPIVVPDASGDGTHTIGVGQADTLNTNVANSNSGAWSALRGGALWVRPNGDMLSSGGGFVPAGTTVTLTGTGECYWRNPAKYAGEREGSCNPCNPLWAPGMTAIGAACSLLTRTCWTRHAREVVTNYSFPFSAQQSSYIKPLADQGDCVSHDPPMVCSGVPPTVIGGCQPWQSAPPNVPTTNHPTSSGASGVVNNHAINSPPAG